MRSMQRGSDQASPRACPSFLWHEVQGCVAPAGSKVLRAFRASVLTALDSAQGQTADGARRMVVFDQRAFDLGKL